MAKPVWQEHEEAMREAIAEAWAPGGMYERVAANRQPFRRALRGGFRSAYGALLPKRGEILVPGAGTGFDRILFPPGIPLTRIMFSDIHAPALRELESRYPGARTKTGSTYNLPFKPGRFGAVAVLDSFDVFPSDALPKAVGDAMRVLKPGGVMIAGQSSLPTTHWSRDREALEAQVGSPSGPTDELLEDLHARYTEGLMGAMRGAGLEDVKMEPVSGLYIGPRERRHEVRMPRISVPGSIPGLIAERGKVNPTYLTDRHLAGLGLPTVRQIFAAHRDPVAEVFRSYVVHGRKPAKRKRRHK